MDRLRKRIAGKRVLALVKTFLKAGILGQDGTLRDSNTGVPQGGILSPVLANLALSVLDESIAQIPGGPGSTQGQRAVRRRRSQGNYRLVRYADLCRARHKSAYAEDRIMPILVANCLAGRGSAVCRSA